MVWGRRNKLLTYAYRGTNTVGQASHQAVPETHTQSTRPVNLAWSSLCQTHFAAPIRGICEEGSALSLNAMLTHYANEHRPVGGARVEPVVSIHRGGWKQKLVLGVRPGTFVPTNRGSGTRIRR